MLAFLLIAVLHYTIPAREAPCGCDSVCHPTPDSTFVWHRTEVMGWIEVWYSVRYGTWVQIRDKDVSGREGQVDTLQVPSDTLATIYLVARDAHGNRSCQSNPWTVAGRTGVDLPPPATAYWIDIQGRKYRTKPIARGLYWEVAPPRPRRLIFIR